MSIVLIVVVLFVLVLLLQTIKIVPQKQVKIIERLGKYHYTAEAGLNTIGQQLATLAGAMQHDHSEAGRTLPLRAEQLGK